MKTDEFRKMAIEVRSKIAKAVFDDKVSTRGIDDVEYRIIEEALRNAHNRAVDECAEICSVQATEWDSDGQITDKNYAGYCADAIRRLRRE